MPATTQRTKRLNIPVTPAEHKHAMKEAQGRGKDLAEAVRDALRKDGLLKAPKSQEKADAL